MSRPPRHAGPRSTRLLLGICGLLVLIIAGFAFLTVTSLTGGTTAKSPRNGLRAAAATPTPGQAVASATTSLPDPDWHTYTFPSDGFRLDIPIVLYPQHSLLINNGTGEQTDWVYQGATRTSPVQERAAETTVIVRYSTTIAETNLCPTGGTPITIGAGIRAFEEANAPPDSNGPAASQLYVRVSVVTGGVAIQIELEGQGAPDTFFSRYGPIWQHMLASFGTFDPLQPLTTHPCS